MPNFYDPQDDRDTPTREDQRALEERQRRQEQSHEREYCMRCGRVMVDGSCPLRHHS